MPLRWDSDQRFLFLNIDKAQKMDGTDLADSILRETGGRERARILVRVEDELPPGMEWRMEWMSFVVKHRKRLRVAIVRKGMLGSTTRWGDLVGLEIREFNREPEAIAWLTSKP